MANKFTIAKAPYIRSVDEKKTSTSRMMLDLLIALTPIIIFGFINNGLLPFLNNTDKNIWHLLRPLCNVFVGGFFSVLFEGLYFLIFKKVRGFKNILEEVHLSFACIPGILLALTLPVTTPLWIIVLGSFIANIIFKMLFGGFGHNIFNPALIAYAFIALCFSNTINTGYSEYLEITNISGATPLTNYQSVFGDPSLIVSKETIVDVYGGFWNFFLGLIPGTIGETSTLLCLVGFVYLVVRKVIDWYVPTIYVGTVFIITFLIGLINGYDGLWFSLFHVFSGGLMFGAVFMATEPVTTPKNPIAKIIYAISIGILTTLFRLVGSMSGGVATSILFMCLFTPLLDRFGSIIRVNKINLKRGLTLGLIIAIMLGVSSYVVAKNIRGNPEVLEENEIENENSFVIEVKGHNGPIKVEFKYDDGKIISMNPFEHNESVLYSEAVKEAFEKYPDALVNANDNYKEVENITSATYSCEALKKAYENALKKLKSICAEGYIDYVSKNKITVLISGNVELMKIDFTYDEYDISSMEVSYYNEYNNYDQNVLSELLDYPNKLIASKSEFNKLENIPSAILHSEKLKKAYELCYNYLHSRYLNGKILNDSNNEIKMIINGDNSPVNVSFVYNDELKITKINLDKNIEGIDTFLDELVNAQGKYQNVENEANQNSLCNVIKTSFGYAYNYLSNKVVIERITDSKIISTIKGQNGLIRIMFEYSGTTLLQMKVLEHFEQLTSEEEQALFNQLQIDFVKNGYYTDKVTFDDSNVSYKVLKTSYVGVNNYLLLDKLSNYSNGVILAIDGESRLLKVAVKGHNNPIVVEFNYDEENHITSMNPIFHGESVAYSAPVKNAFETIPDALVSSNGNIDSVDNITGATVSCNALKKAYKIAYDYLTYGVAIESETEDEIKTYVKGHNSSIRILFKINEESKITEMIPYEHNESVMYSAPVKNAFETIPDALVSSNGNVDSVDNIAGASVSITALKKSYSFVYDYLKGGRK